MIVSMKIYFHHSTLTTVTYVVFHSNGVSSFKCLCWADKFLWEQILQYKNTQKHTNSYTISILKKNYLLLTSATNTVVHSQAHSSIWQFKITG